MAENSGFDLKRFLTERPLTLAPALLAGITLAIALGYFIGSGEFESAGAILATCFTVAIFMRLGDKYWLLIPLAFTFQLGVIPIGDRAVELPEIVIIICFAVFLTRYALKMQKFSLFREAHAPILIYVGWAFIIFMIHPVGFVAGGADVGGARYYSKLAMALAAFLIMANQKLSERDCNIVLGLTLIGSLFYCVKNIALFFLGSQYGGASEADLTNPDNYYSWHQSLAIVPLVAVPMIFAKFRSKEIFSLQRVWIPLSLGLCILLTLLSGKRTGLLTIPIYMVSAALLRKEWKFLVVWIGAGLLAITFIVMGHGNAFTLPLTVQRGLSWLPATWDSQLVQYEGGNDPFRVKMNQLATDRIKADPWIGRGFEVDQQLIIQAENVDLNNIDSICYRMAIGAQWHNAWLGVMADFGIPAALFQAMIYWQFITLGWRLFKRLTVDSPMRTLAAFILLYTIADLGRSWHGGQSATHPFDTFWKYGVLVALAVMIELNKSTPSGQLISPAGSLVGNTKSANLA